MVLGAARGPRSSTCRTRLRPRRELVDPLVPGAVDVVDVEAPAAAVVGREGDREQPALVDLLVRVVDQHPRAQVGVAACAARARARPRGCARSARPRSACASRCGGLRHVDRLVGSARPGERRAPRHHAVRSVRRGIPRARSAVRVARAAPRAPRVDAAWRRQPASPSGSVEVRACTAEPRGPRGCGRARARRRRARARRRGSARPAACASRLHREAVARAVRVERLRRGALDDRPAPARRALLQRDAAGRHAAARSRP